MIFPGMIFGLTVFPTGGLFGSVISASPGICSDSTAVDTIQLSETGFLKVLNGGGTSGWEPGSGNPGLDVGVDGVGWYAVHAIKNPSTGAVDILYSRSATAPALPAGFTLFRLIDWVYNNSSGVMVSQVRLDDTVLYTTPFHDIAAPALGLASELFPLMVPPGTQVEALIRGYASNPVLVTSPEEAAAAVSISNRSAGAGAFSLKVRTDLNQKIRAVANVAATTFQASTYGYINCRGRSQ